MSFVIVGGARHAMIRHHGQFSRWAAEFAVATLLGAERGYEPSPPALTDQAVG